MMIRPARRPSTSTSNSNSKSNSNSNSMCDSMCNSNSTSTGRRSDKLKGGRCKSCAYISHAKPQQITILF